jgi:2-dehydro-3-deoxyphosphooctonate aldolase (KDO 8-P synthase)
MRIVLKNWITDALQIPFVFKGSFKKANRSRIDSFQELVTKSIKILRKVSGFWCSNRD